MGPHVLLGIFIPPLIFESAFGTDFHVIRREFFQALLLAGPGVIFNVLFTTLFCYYAFPYQWTVAESVSFAAIVSATDPVAVVALLRDLGASKRLATLIEGESLLNDGSAFVLFAIAVKFVVEDRPPTGGEIIKDFCVLTFGGVITGIAFGICVVIWLRLVFNDERVEIVITLIACYLCFWFCENIGAEYGNEMSGVLGTVFLGLFVSKYKSAISQSVEQSLHHFWEVISYIANTLIFVFGGIVVVLGIIEDDRLTVSGSEIDVIRSQDIGWLILLYFIIHIARFLTIMILWWPLLKTGYKISFRECIVLTFAGLRGVISLSLALILKLWVEDNKEESIKYQDQAMFHVAGIVALTLAVNGSCMRLIVNSLGLLKMSKDTEIILKDAMHHLRNENKKTINHLKVDTNYNGANWEEVTKALPSYAHIMGKKKKKLSYGHKPICYYWCCQCSSCCLNKPVKTNTNSSLSQPGDLSKKGGYKSLATDLALKGRHNESKFITRRFGIDNDIDICDTIKEEEEENKQEYEGDNDQNALPLQVTELTTKQFSDIQESKEHSPNIEEIKFDDNNTSSNNIINLPNLASNPTFNRTFSVDLTPLTLQKTTTMDDIEFEIINDKTPIEEHSTSNKKQLNRSEIEHRILQVLQRSFDTEYEEGNITLDSFMVLENAIDKALGFEESHADIDNINGISSLSILKDEICKAFKVNPLVKWAYKQCQNGLTQYFLLHDLSLAIEVGLVFSSSFQSLPSKIEIILAIRNNHYIGDILTELHKYATEINNEWMCIHEEYPEVYTAIQTKHAVQSVLHHETHDITRLYNRGVLDDSEKQRMTKLLLQTQHNIYFSSFYYVTSIYGTSLSHKQTLLSVLFMTKLNCDTYEQVIENLFSKIELKKWKEGQYIISTHERKQNGIYIIVSGRCALLECGQFSMHIQNNNDNDNDNDKKQTEEDDHSINSPLIQPIPGTATNEHEMYLQRGSIIGGYEYLAGLKYLNPCIAKTDVIAYFINNNILEELLNEEEKAYKTLWKQCAGNLILSMYPKNDKSFFSQFNKTEINNMCQKGQFIEYNSDNKNE
eukprot:501285_1